MPFFSFFDIHQLMYGVQPEYYILILHTVRLTYISEIQMSSPAMEGNSSDKSTHPQKLLRYLHQSTKEVDF